MLEQFSKGLETLGVLCAVRKNRAVFEELFTSKTKLTPEVVKSMIKPKHGSSDCSNEETLFGYIQKFVDESNENGKYQAHLLIRFIILFSLAPCLTSILHWFVTIIII